MRTILAVMGVLGLAGCAGLDGGSSSPPPRPTVSVPDEVQSIDRSKLVGTWTCRELNPMQGAPVLTSVNTYNADGTFTGTSKGSSDGQALPFVTSVTGNWAIQGDRIVSSNIKTSAKSSDGNPAMDMIAGLGSSIANTMIEKEPPGLGNVLKLTSTELVVKAEGVDNPPVISCTRG